MAFVSQGVHTKCYPATSSFVLVLESQVSKEARCDSQAMVNDIETGSHRACTDTDAADPAIELGAYSPSHCKFEPIELCGHHRNLYGTVSTRETRHDGSSSVDVAFQAYSVLANFKHFQERLSMIAPVRHTISTRQVSACWLLEVSVKLHKYLTESDTPDALTWDSAAAYLQQQSLIRGTDRDGDGDIQLSHYFVFCLLWVLLQLDAVPLRHQFPHWELPKRLRQHTPLSDKHGRTSVDEEWVLDPTKLNADILGNILKIGVTWTDTLGAHLDFDDVSNTLYLFRQATFCLLNATPPEEGRTCPKSRRAFKEDQVFNEIPQRDRDRLLQSLCNGQADLASFNRRQKRFYNIKTDFPSLGRGYCPLPSMHNPRSPQLLSSYGGTKGKPFNGGLSGLSSFLDPCLLSCPLLKRYFQRCRFTMLPQKHVHEIDASAVVYWQYRSKTVSYGSIQPYL
ncbi:hypothetical protein PG997_014451 [Apiospora hydei]|uniref:Fungal-type protein kinase domain-containing protein n=1 Tax=Apiospora hydei TaxID=1337664 RepID=A0ABR1UTU9_9PEZI